MPFSRSPSVPTNCGTRWNSCSAGLRALRLEGTTAFKFLLTSIPNSVILRARLKRCALILALFLLPIAAGFAQALMPGPYWDQNNRSGQILFVNVGTNNSIRIAWGTVNRINGSVRARAAGEATLKANGRITGIFSE